MGLPFNEPTNTSTIALDIAVGVLRLAARNRRQQNLPILHLASCVISIVDTSAKCHSVMPLTGHGLFSLAKIRNT